MAPCFGQRSLDLIVLHPKIVQLAQMTPFYRQGSAEGIGTPQPHAFQAGHCTPLGWKRAVQVVVVQLQACKLLQCAPIDGQSANHGVIRQPETF